MVIKILDNNKMCMIYWKIELFVLDGYEYPYQRTYNVQQANVWILYCSFLKVQYHQFNNLNILLRT